MGMMYFNFKAQGGGKRLSKKAEASITVSSAMFPDI